MRAARLIAVWLGVLALVPAAGTASVARTAVPTGLHAFLLRADEPVVHSFPRTPSFAWNPVRGAVRYQFQLATSSAFRENGIVTSLNNLSTPVAAPRSTLPWTSNNLYARVRAIFRNGASPWSAAFTFDMTPPAAPSPLPTSPTEIPDARASYIATDGPEPQGYMYDGSTVSTTESMPAATPTTAVPSDQDSGSSASATTTSAPSQLTLTGNLGAPVDLWDTDWPNGGYYWTVVPVQAVSPGALSTSVALPGSAANTTTIPVTSAFEFATGDTVLIGTTGNQEAATVTSVKAPNLTLAAPLKFAHGVGEPVVRTGGNLQYRDLELPQDVCAAGRVMRFGKDSEPSLTAAGDLFASGLSSSGRLVSAHSTSKFYGNPLVAWTPAFGAYAYEVQWSKTRYPFKPEPDPENQNALGTMTMGTSAVLPLKPGTWYYRVRGFDFSLRTGSQMMSWSDPAKIVVAKPKFKIVGGK